MNTTVFKTNFKKSMKTRLKMKCLDYLIKDLNRKDTIGLSEFLLTSLQKNLVEVREKSVSNNDVLFFVTKDYFSWIYVYENSTFVEHKIKISDFSFLTKEHLLEIGKDADVSTFFIWLMDGNTHVRMCSFNQAHSHVLFKKYLSGKHFSKGFTYSTLYKMAKIASKKL